MLAFWFSSQKLNKLVMIAAYQFHWESRRQSIWFKILSFWFSKWRISTIENQDSNPFDINCLRFDSQITNFTSSSFFSKLKMNFLMIIVIFITYNSTSAVNLSLMGMQTFKDLVLTGVKLLLIKVELVVILGLSKLDPT